MTNDEALNLLSARLDGELSPDQQTALADWLHENPEGQILAEAFQVQNSELRAAFEARRTAAALTAKRVAEQVVTPKATPAKHRLWTAYLAPFIAASLLATVTYFAVERFGHHQSLVPEIAKRLPPPDVAAVGLKPLAKQPAPQVLALKAGESMQTAAGEKRRVGLPDGSTLYLNQNTQVSLAADRELKVQAGEIFLEAVPAAQLPVHLPFRVETPRGELRALGTKFAVAVKTESTSVLVTQGSVQIDGIAEAVHAGQQLRAPQEQVPHQSPRASATLDWTRDLMAAAETPLVPAGQYEGGALVAIDPNGQESKLSLVKYTVDVHIEDGFARTTIDQTYFNNENSQLEGTFYFPLPPDASLSRLAMYISHEDGTASLMEGGMAERQHARQTYERIRYARRDPALLEWVDGSLFKMRVFPLEARQQKRILLSYTQKLPVLYGRTTYRFPAGHSLNRVDDWTFQARIHNAGTLSASSPSHPGMKTQHEGNDLLLRDAAHGVRPDRDVVVELDDTVTQPNTARWSLSEQDGSKYLMLRYRPELPSAPKRERRDWVFLFESSGARDPLVARTQVEVIRSLLTQADHDDTFALLTVGSRVHVLEPEPLPVTPENIDRAVAFLEQSHLIGALDLESALREAEPFLSRGSQAHLVHVGGGVATLGERRDDPLIGMIPKGAHYVGVAVGKRYSRTFMKTAAEKTGGLFTIINPDEPVGWRGFELASTLNTPRLLDARVSCNDPKTHFLMFGNAIAQGEELAAVAQIDGDTYPSEVTVRGTLDGQPYEETIRVANQAKNADYLPRTWAKLEIDRLLADNPPENKDKIIDLSKAMVVMTPYTSLLVLENDAMYREFNVDRGRKDHWAMYQTPEKIPVEYIPDPSQPASATSPRFRVERPHRNQVMQTLLSSTPPQFLTWPGRDDPGLPQRVGNFIIEGGKRMSDALLLGDGIVTPDLPAPLNLPSADFGIRGGRAMREYGLSHDRLEDLLSESEDLSQIVKEGERFHSPMAGKPWLRLTDRDGSIDSLGITTSFGSVPGSDDIIGAGWGARGGDADVKTGLLSYRGRPGSSQPLAWFDSTLDDLSRSGSEISVNGTQLSAQPSDPNASVSDTQLGLYIYGAGINATEGGDHALVIRGTGRFHRKLSEKLTNDFAMPPTSNMSDLYDPISLDFFAQPNLQSSSRGLGTPTFEYSSLAKSDPVNHYHLFNPSRSAMGRSFGEKGITRFAFAGIPDLDGEGIDDQGEFLRLLESQGIFLDQSPQPLPRYSRLTFSRDERVFTDLPSYAPGLTSSRADTLSVIEAEAAIPFSQRKGKIDPEAKKLIESARGSAWHSTRLGKGSVSALTILHDGQGRYTYKRQLPSGLREEVVCNGTTLLHLYPEIGLAAERSVTRFHRNDLRGIIPSFLPPAEDMNVGADVRSVDAKTVEIVPLNPSEIVDPDTARVYVKLQLVIEGGKLKERQWLLVLESKKQKRDPRLLLREVYSEDGKVQWFDGKGNASPVLEHQRLAAKEPDLHPDLRELVVLPLPKRNRQTVYRKYELDPQQPIQGDTNACYAYLKPEAALELLASEAAEGRANEAHTIWRTCFAEKGDRRPGFYALLRAVGVNVSDLPEFREAIEAQVNANSVTPLMRYLGQAFDTNTRLLQERFGILPGPDAGKETDFLGKLLTLRALAIRWGSPLVHEPVYYHSKQERERAYAFARANAGNTWGWSALTLVGDQANSPEFHKEVAAVWKDIAEKSPLRYEARYEQARELLSAKDEVGATKIYRELFTPALANGVLLPLDEQFHNAFPQDQWQALMREAVKKLADKDLRPLAVRFAWQCHVLGDQPLAEELLRDLLDSPGDKYPIATRLAAIQFLKSVGNIDWADNLCSGLLENPKLQRSPVLWRQAAEFANGRQQTMRHIECMEKALDLEYAQGAPVVNLEAIRKDYGELLDHYDWLANASRSLQVAPPEDLLIRTVRAADRWRAVDPEADKICQQAATILRKAGNSDAERLAWDYLTTPLALNPNDSSPWLSLAQNSSRSGDVALAERCYREAHAAEPTNAQILWDEAQLLKLHGKPVEARAVMEKIATGDWQPRFEGLKLQSRHALTGW